MYYSEYGTYPVISTTTYCPISPSTIDDKYCLKPSSGNKFGYFPIFGSSQSFTLVANRTSTSYSVTDNSVPVSGSANWIAGIVGTVLENKWVRSADLVSPIYNIQYKTFETPVASTQGATNIDQNLPSSKALFNPQTNPTVDFSEYPAQNACKVIGGRLPTTQELKAIYTDKVTTYGNNFTVNHYWSSTEYDNTFAFTVYSGDNYAYGRSKTMATRVRCVSG